MFEKLTLKSIDVRAVSVPLRRPVVSKVGLFNDWPLILIDLTPGEGIVGRSYLEPYLRNAARSIVPVIHDLAAAQREASCSRRSIDFQTNRRSLNLIGYEGVAMIAVAGLDMAIWDALAKSRGHAACGPARRHARPGAGLQQQRSLAHRRRNAGAGSGGLVAEGGFAGLKLRLGRDRLADDLAAIREVRNGAGDDIKLMVDFNQGLSLGDALHRCHALDDQGLYWFEEPIAYDNLSGYAQLTRELATPVQLGENFYGPRDLYEAVRAGAGDYVMPDLMRIGGVSGWLRAAPIAAAAGIQVSTHLYPEVSAHLMRVTETAHWLEWQDWADPILKKPFAVKDSHVEIPDVPGVGIEWDEAAVARYRYEL